MGTLGSSKTTALGCLSLTADVLSAEVGNFKHFINEKSSGICQVPADLCIGKFPEPTPSGSVYEADIYMTRAGTFGDKTICIPVGETSGEDIENLIGPYKKKVYEQAPTWTQAEGMANTVVNSNGFIVILPVNRATIPGLPLMEEEPSSLYGNPDVNLKRILTAIFSYKMNNKSAPPIDGIAVLLAKYDTISDHLTKGGMDLYNDIGAKKFLTTYFRQTSGALKWFGLEKVKFFPVHVNVKKFKDDKGKVGFVKRRDGKGYDIELDYNRNLPKYSEQSYKKLIYWLFDTFG